MQEIYESRRYDVEAMSGDAVSVRCSGYVTVMAQYIHVLGSCSLLLFMFKIFILDSKTAILCCFYSKTV